MTTDCIQCFKNQRPRTTSIIARAKSTITFFELIKEDSSVVQLNITIKLKTEDMCLKSGK